jgi:hypothetical protein
MAARLLVVAPGQAPRIAASTAAVGVEPGTHRLMVSCRPVHWYSHVTWGVP